jgi:succinate dehydrogenase / fumarate reductase cytochrome b subunit
MGDTNISYKRRRLLNRLFRRTLWGEKMNLGAYMWILQRITGLCLLFYLFLHLYTLASILEGENSFNRTMALMDGAVIKFLELGLLWIAIFHALNGIRLILINLFVGINEKVMAYGVCVATIVFLALGIPFIY